jgi:nucleoside-diphosphate-sugar epimerase
MEIALQGADILVHVAGIEYAPQVVGAARKAGVGRIIVVSSTSAHSSYEFRSAPKLRMEKVVRESGLDWTILRPTMIYGSELDKNMRRLLSFLDRSTVFPIFGTGENLWQPVYYKDCARGILSALERPTTVGEIYDLPGGEPLSYSNMVSTAAVALDRRPHILRIPAEPVRRVLAFTETFGLPLPVKSEQVLRLREDKAYPYEKARNELDYRPRNFQEGIVLEVARLREKGVLKS